MPLSEAAFNSSLAFGLFLWAEGVGIGSPVPRGVEVRKDWQKHTHAQECHLTEVYDVLTSQNQLSCFLSAHTKVCWGGRRQCGNKEDRKP